MTGAWYHVFATSDRRNFETTKLKYGRLFAVILLLLLSVGLPVANAPLSPGVLYGRLQRVTIPDAVIIQYDLLKMSIILLETCRGL